MRTCSGAMARRSVVVGLLFFTSACAEGEPVEPSPETSPEMPARFSAVSFEDAPADDLPPAFVPPTDVGDAQEWLDVGPLAVQGGRSSPVLVTIPEGAQSLTVYARGHAGALLLLDEAVGPESQVLVSPRWPLTAAEAQFSGARGFPAQFFSPTRQVARATDALTRLPLRDVTPLTPGLWSLRVRSARVDQPAAAFDRPLRMALLLDRERAVSIDADPPTETLALALHFVGTSLGAEGALDDNDFVETMDALKEILAEARIEVEIVSLHDEDAIDSILTLDPSLGCSGGDLDTLFQTGDQSSPGALHLYFVERFRCVSPTGIDVGAFISGLAGGIPASTSSPGTSRGGVAVAVDSEGTPDGFATATLAELLAHEIGHALGLFHVMETTAPPDPEVFDIISDTVDDEGALQSNLMFPRINGRTRLSDGQSQVMRRHPGVRQ